MIQRFPFGFISTLCPIDTRFPTESNGFEVSTTLNAPVMIRPHWNAICNFFVPKFGRIRPSAIENSLYPLASPILWFGKTPSGNVETLAPGSMMRSNSLLVVLHWTVGSFLEVQTCSTYLGSLHHLKRLLTNTLACRSGTATACGPLLFLFLLVFSSFSFSFFSLSFLLFFSDLSISFSSAFPLFFSFSLVLFVCFLLTSDAGNFMLLSLISGISSSSSARNFFSLLVKGTASWSFVNSPVDKGNVCLFRPRHLGWTHAHIGFFIGQLLRDPFLQSCSSLCGCSPPLPLLYIGNSSSSCFLVVSCLEEYFLPLAGLLHIATFVFTFLTFTFATNIVRFHWSSTTIIN